MSPATQPAKSDAIASGPRLGVIFPPDQPPQRLRQVATTAEDAGLDELWLWEDCFAESGIGPAAAALAWTERISVGIGLLPVPLRNVALTAMEIATVAELFPDRLLPGIGHGVLDWMAQAGVRAESPMTLLREYAVALRALLDGETVTTTGRYVSLDEVALRWPPTQRVPLYIGGMGPKTVRLAAELGDGVILTAPTPADVASGIAHVTTTIGDRPKPAIVNFLSVPVAITADELEVRVREQLSLGVDHIPVCGLSAEGPPESGPALLDLIPVIAEVRSRLAR